MACKCGTAAALLLLLASVSVLIAIAVVQGHLKHYKSTFKYGIVIDAGSSRSNVYLYQWPAEKENDTGVVSEVINLRVNADAISLFGVDKKKDEVTWEAFRVCMANVSAAIPARQHKDTPIFLGATAGMRLLQRKDEQRSDKILQDLGSYLRSLPFTFHNASIISGEEEGLYGWVTVNYLKGNYLERTPWNSYLRPVGAQTVGSMDLGGASTQIAFAIPGEATGGQDVVPVRLYGYPYNVYSHSFLCYGKVEAERKFLDVLLRVNPTSDTVSNPCVPQGYTYWKLHSDIYSTECVRKPANYEPTRNVTFVGTGNSDLCGQEVRKTFDFTSCVGQNCSFNGVSQPPVTGDFMAYAGFYWTAKALNLAGKQDLDTFNSTMKEFCHTNWAALRASRVNTSDSYLKSYCYSAHYVFTILTEGYKFNKETFSDIDFQSKVEKTSVGWALGYMLTQSNMIPAEPKELFLPMPNSAFAGLVFIFSALTIITVVYLFIALVRTCY